MDKGKYMISIIGEQKVDGESDRVELLTGGSYMMKSGRHLINYKEYSEDEPNEVCNNFIKVENETVTITRNGSVKTQLLLEKGKRHQCLYQTPAGDLMIGIFTHTLNNNLNEKGGSLEVSYTLDFNADLISENSFKINIEEKI